MSSPGDGARQGLGGLGGEPQGDPGDELHVLHEQQYGVRDDKEAAVAGLHDNEHGQGRLDLVGTFICIQFFIFIYCLALTFASY